MGRGWSCQPTRVRFLGFAPKNLLTHPISKAQLDSPLVTGPSMCVDRLFLRDTGTVYGWGGGLEGFLGLCEKVLLSFVKMPWGGLSLTDQVFVFEASQGKKEQNKQHNRHQSSPKNEKGIVLSAPTHKRYSAISTNWFLNICIVYFLN